MLKPVLSAILAAPLVLATLGGANAFTPSTGLGTQGSPMVTSVRWVCNASRCIDPRTGAYTQSGCNYRGCYPIGGIVGYDTPSYGGGGGYGYGDGGGYGYGNGGGYGRPYYPGYRRRWQQDDDD